MNDAFDVVPMVSVHPDRINVYNEVIWHRTRPKRNPAENLAGVSNDHAGKVSVAARRKIHTAIKYLLFLSTDKRLPDTRHGKFYKFKIAFITLTLPSSQVHPDNEIKEKCLNQFLVELRKKWHVKNYIWRAEKQKNGNIHFHLLVDKFIPWSELRDCWNRITNKLGYVDRYRKEMLAFHAGGFQVRKDLLKSWEYKAQIKAYQKGKANDWTSPNSTDIHSVYKIRNIEAYLSKYYAKDEQTEGLKGRLWGCNFELSNVPGGRIIVDSSVSKSLDDLCERFNPKVYQGSYFSTIFITMDMLRAQDGNILFKTFASFLLSHFNYNIQLCMSPD